MPKLIGGLTALIALSGGILAQVDPMTTVVRAGIAFLVAYVLTMVWYVFFATQVQPIRLNPVKRRKADPEAEAKVV
ncbi:MAG: hypothetical protein KF784_13600 [Fimbriimonadaceae bacterium]|nr:hypothetical protein [Fimbriimonadaceae bacterium]